MSKSEEKSVAARKLVEATSFDVDLAEDDLRDAKRLLRAAEKDLAAIEEEVEAPIRAEAEVVAAALVAERSGPMRPAGARVVRTVCAVAEIPPEHAVRKEFGKLKGIIGTGGDSWATNGHWMLRVDSVDGMETLPDTAESVLGEKGALVARDDAPRKVGSHVVRTFGGAIAADLRYASLVEDLFPCVEWHCRGADLEPLHAVVRGEIVAMIMPVRNDALAAGDAS